MASQGKTNKNPSKEQMGESKCAACGSERDLFKVHGMLEYLCPKCQMTEWGICHLLDRMNGSRQHLAAMRSHIEWQERVLEGLDRIEKILRRYIVDPDVDREFCGMRDWIKRELAEDKADLYWLERKNRREDGSTERDEEESV